MLGTLDTKYEEIMYLYSQVEKVMSRGPYNSNKITLVDCGRQRSPADDRIDITHDALVSRWAPKDGCADNPASMSRGEAVKFMTECTRACVKDIWGSENGKGATLHGIISAGGSGGTSLASAVMREAIPIGVPKLIVSTIASGDTSSVVGETDITMMYSVVDIAGTNELLRTILSNAAGAIVGMAGAYEELRKQSAETSCIDATKPGKTKVGITMFGVTTPCVDKMRQHLEDNFSVEVYVFHATGHGGKAMERLIEEGRLDAILDVTTTEICDHLMGGNMSAGSRRLETALKAGIPTIISLGATDMVNFGPRNTVPERYHSRKLFEHNPSVTLMRTTKEECKQVGDFIVDKILTFARRPEMVEVRLPKGGVSLIATPKEAFADAKADKELRDTLMRGLDSGNTAIRIVEDERAINDEGFAIDAAESLMRLVSLKNKAT